MQANIPMAQVYASLIFISSCLWDFFLHVNNTKCQLLTIASANFWTFSSIFFSRAKILIKPVLSIVFVSINYRVTSIDIALLVIFSLITISKKSWTKDINIDSWFSKFLHFIKQRYFHILSLTDILSKLPFVAQSKLRV